MRAANSTNEAVSQALNGDPQPSTSGFTSNQDHGTSSGQKTVSQNEQKSAVNENLQKSADSKIKEEEYTFDHEASHLDKDVKNEIKTETTFGKVHGNRASTNANAAEVKQESSDDRILETSSQVCCMHKNCT